MVTYRCEGKPYPSFQCADLSDETRCDFKPEPLKMNPALMSLEFDKQSQCFKQAFTFTALNESMLKRNYPDNNMRKFASNYEFSLLRTAAVVSTGINIGLTFLGVLLLSCIGCVTEHCKSMRAVFIGLSVIYIICLALTLFIGIFWVNYVNALNEVVENPAESDIYERVAIETIKVTGGFASIRISTNLTFYNCGFFGLAFILSLLAAHLVKTASCHQHIVDTEKYRPTDYNGDLMTTRKLLPGSHSMSNSDAGRSTPDQTVLPQRAFRTIQSQQERSPNGIQPRQASPAASSSYIPYDRVDSIERSQRSLPSSYAMSARQTLERSVIKQSQV